MSRSVYIELPSEDPMSGEEGKHLVGNITRPCMGPEMLRPVVSTPCLYYHPTLDIRVLGHVDHLICVGSRAGLDIFLAKSISVYDLTSTFQGPGLGDGSFLDEA